MSSVPITKIVIENTSVDAASYVGTNWIAMGDQNGRLALLAVETAIATQAILYKVLSATTSGASPFATIAMNSGATVIVDQAYGWDTFIKASTYMNFQFSATTTVKEFYCVERQRW